MLRYDSIEITAKAHVDTDGYLYDTPVLTLAEKVFNYQNPDGSIRREYRPSTEVFDEDSLKSFKGRPITVMHPSNMLNSSTATKLSIGTVLSEGKHIDDKLVADIVIHDPKALGEKRELSLGYNLDLDFTPGETKTGEKYDAVQRNIKINHLAVVSRGRAGREARLNLDGDEILFYEKGDNNMVKITIRGINYDAAPEVANEIKELENAKENLKKETETLKGERDGLKAKLDAKETEAEKNRKDAEENFDAKVKERLSILKKAQDFNVANADEMTNDDIKKAVIKSVHGDSIDLEGKSSDYISALFDASNLDNEAIATQRQKAFNKDSKENQTKTKTAAEARLDMIEKMKLGGK